MSSASKPQSVYTQCAAAIDRLINDPPREGGVFTEIDVMTEAATKVWSKGQFDEAMHQANEVCGQRYRKRRLCRYGPVKIGKGESKIEDYARIAGKIVYADAVNGPEYWETPNGRFKKMMEDEDTLSRQGRKPASKRNDAEPWDQQALPAKPRKNPRRTTRRLPTGMNGKERDVMELVMHLSERVKSLEEDKERRDKFAQEQAKRMQTTAA